jgi:hypothetical protein
MSSRTSAGGSAAAGGSPAGGSPAGGSSAGGGGRNRVRGGGGSGGGDDHRDHRHRGASASTSAFPKIRRVPRGLLHLIGNLNAAMNCFEINFGLSDRHQTSFVQADAAARCQLHAALEQHDRATRFFGNDAQSFLLQKMFKLLCALGKTHVLTRTSLLHFMAMSTPNPVCMVQFADHFVEMLMRLEAKERMWWMVVWMCVMTMTEIPYLPEWHEGFFAWFDARMTSVECTVDLDDELTDVLTDIMRRTEKFFTAVLSVTPKPTDKVALALTLDQRIAAACRGLNIEAPQRDEDNEVDPDDTKSQVSNASSIGGANRPNPRGRYLAGCQRIAQLMAFQREGHEFFTKLSDPDLIRLVAGLMRRMTRRSTGPISLRRFNDQLCYKLLRFINSKGKSYRLNLTEIALRICQATGNIAIALRWFELASAIKDSEVKQVNRALQAAIVLMMLGNFAWIEGEPHESSEAASAILDELFGVEKMPASVSTEVVLSTFRDAWEAIKAAREGRWIEPKKTDKRQSKATGRGGEADDSSEHHDSQPPAGAAGGGAAQTSSGDSSRPFAAAGGGSQTSSGNAKHSSSSRSNATGGKGGSGKSASFEQSSRPSAPASGSVPSIEEEEAKLMARLKEIREQRGEN